MYLSNIEITDKMPEATLIIPGGDEFEDEDEGEGWDDIEDEDFEDELNDRDDFHEIELEENELFPEDDDHLPDDDDI